MSTKVNSLSTILGSWGMDNLIKKPKKIMKPNSQSNTILNDKIIYIKKSIKKKKKNPS